MRKEPFPLPTFLGNRTYFAGTIFTPCEPLRPKIGLGSVLALGFGLSLILAPAAMAQTMNSSASGYNAGYGRSLGQENQAYIPPGRDANHNRVVVDGIIQNGNDYSALARSNSIGTTGISGAGVQGGASAIGNNLQVVVQGNWNTVVVNSTQINNGNVTANANGTIAQARPQGRATQGVQGGVQNSNQGQMTGIMGGTYGAPAATSGVGSGEILLNGRVNLEQGPF